MVIGVTGHRVFTDIDKLEAGVDEAICRLAAAFPGPWIVVSALAEGADRLVARRLLGREGTRLVAVLPLKRRDYEGDFTSEDSRREFADLLGLADEVVQVPPQSTRDEAYEAAGQAVLARAKALLAIWDGQGAHGRGGTGATVAAARAHGMPLAWVHAGNRVPGTVEPTSLGDGEGEVTFERLPATREEL